MHVAIDIDDAERVALIFTTQGLGNGEAMIIDPGSTLGNFLQRLEARITDKILEEVRS